MERFSISLFLILVPLISLAIPLFFPLPAEIVPLLIALLPAFLAILFTALTGGGKGISALMRRSFQWRVGIKWYVVAVGLALALRLAMSLLAIAFGWIPAFQLRLWSPMEFALIGVFILIGGTAEELGWRGYVLHHFLARRSALFSALFLGVIWGVVHLGLTFPGMMNAGTPWLPTILQLIGLSVILTWLYVQTGGSIVFPVLFHAGQNLLVVLNGGISLTQQLWLLTIVALAFALALAGFYGVHLERTRLEKPVMADAR
jgi:membrane protease YdiL (CAAX protease family)